MRPAYYAVAIGSLYGFGLSINTVQQWFADDSNSERTTFSYGADDPADCDITQRTCREIRTALATEGIEDANWAATVLSAAAFIVALAGTWYLRNTLLVQRNVGEAQVRAYLGFDPIGWGSTDYGIFLEFNMRNTGQSSARDIMVKYMTSLDGEFISYGPSFLHLPPLGETTFRVRDNEKQFDKMIDSHLQYEVVWWDVFGKKSTVDLRFSLEKNGILSCRVRDEFHGEY